MLDEVKTEEDAAKSSVVLVFSVCVPLYSALLIADGAVGGTAAGGDVLLLLMVRLLLFHDSHWLGIWTFSRGVRRWASGQDFATSLRQFLCHDCAGTDVLACVCWLGRPGTGVLARGAGTGVLAQVCCHGHAGTGVLCQCCYCCCGCRWWWLP